MALLLPTILFSNESKGRDFEPSAAFLKYWKSGLAELSSYTILEERYGEMRQAQGVMVFVYEETNLDTRIKVETDKTIPAKRIPVLKLNNILKFTTGIYDYSIMTSIFSGLSSPGVPRSFAPLKISFSSQEWCGNVYHQVLPMKNGLVSDMHSYFEAEGDSKSTLPYPTGPVYYEDEMPILLRELDGEFLKSGSPLKIQLVPSLWKRRKRHVPLAFLPATLTKVETESFSLNQTQVSAIKWTLESQGITTTFHVEEALPHKLLAWENTLGEQGKLLKSVRKPYWERHENKHKILRKELGLNYGVKEEY